MEGDGLEGGWRDEHTRGEHKVESDCVWEVCGLHGCIFGSPFYRVIIKLRAKALVTRDYHGQRDYSKIRRSNTMQRIV